MEEREEESKAQAKAKSFTEDLGERRDSRMGFTETVAPSGGVYGVLERDSEIGADNRRR